MKGNEIYEFAKQLLLKVQSLSRTQTIIAAVAGTVAIGGVGTGGYMIYNQSHNQNKSVQEASALVDTGVLENATESVFDTEMIMAELLESTELLEATEETETPGVEKKVLSLVGSSMEKDLKIKIVNQNQKVVSGEVFEVSVKTDKDSKNVTTYQDKDKDGIIYIDKLQAGNYVVDLAEIDGYEIKKGSITVAVKGQLEYKKVDITGEVKTEKEINAAVEDTAINNVPIESTLKDTTPFLESTVSASTVGKTEVDQSNFTAASASAEKNTVSITKVTTSSTEIPGTNNTETPDETTKPSDTTKPSETTKPSDTTLPSETTKPSDTMAPSDTMTPSDTTLPSDTTTPSDTTLPGGITTPSDTTLPSDTQEETGNAVLTGTETASIERNRISRTATAAEAAAATATISLPKTITLYYCDNPASTSYQLQLEIEGDASLIKSVSWATTNAEVVELSATTGNAITVSRGANSGTRSANVSAVITYYSDDKGNTKDVVVQTTVEVVNLTDGDIVLKDTAGNELYEDSQTQNKATLSDYNTNNEFYTTPQYTGWRTVEGKVYYYGADNKPVTGNQVIGGVSYTFAADGSLTQGSGTRGIDVSKWQGNIDWGAVAASGIDFAIIRVGYRGASTGALVEDPYFKQNIAGATRAGIKVGVYFFTQAITEAEAVEEASMALSLVSGYNLSFPIFIDTENASNGRANGLDKATRTAVVNAFCRTIANGGRTPGIYASKSWYNTKLNMSVLNSYYIWVAQYNSECTYSGRYNMWQYSSKGTVSGIKGNVDMNICY